MFNLNENPVALAYFVAALAEFDKQKKVSR
jgi:hypothetical protein